MFNGIREIMKQMARKNKKVLELRASLKTLSETRAEYMDQLNALVETAKTEVRAMSEDEQQKFDELEKKIKAIDTSIEMEKRAIDLVVNKTVTENKVKTEAEQRAVDEEAEFEDYIRGVG